MKKILIGLFAMSVASFSTLDLNGQATTETNLWETGQEGRIALKGNFITTPSDVKYVIFTSPDGTLDGAEDVLILPTFTLSQNYNIPTMKGTPQKIYVKKLNDDGSISELTNETVTFTFADYDPEFTYFDALEVPNEQTVDLPVTAFFSKAKLMELLTTAFTVDGVLAGTISVSSTGDPEFRPTGGSKQVYRVPRKFNMKQSSLGVLEMFMSDNGYFKGANTMTPENAKLFEAQFTTTQSGSMAIKARVDLSAN